MINPPIYNNSIHKDKTWSRKRLSNISIKNPFMTRQQKDLF